MKVLFRALLLLLALTTHADAFRKGGLAGSPGNAFMNLGPGETIPGAYVDILKSTYYSFGTATDVTKLDDRGFFTSAPSSFVSLIFPSSSLVGYQGVQYTLAWEDARFTFYLAMAATSCGTPVGASVSCPGNSVTVDTTASTGSVTFTIAAGQDFNAGFFAASSSWSAGPNAKIALYRTSDAARYAAGVYFTPEFETALSGLRARGIRPMGWIHRAGPNWNGDANWSYRNRTDGLQWGYMRFPTGALVGGGSAAISGTDTYTASAAPDTPGSYTDGEVAVGIVANANTSTTVTLNVGGRGAKSVVNGYTYDNPTVGGFYNISAGLGTFTYKAVIDKWVYRPDGIAASVPIEAQIQLANRLNYDLWATLPPMATDNYLTNWMTTIRDNLSPSLLAYLEYSNEVWNGGFPQQYFADKTGQAMGFTAGDEAIYAWQSLRTIQMMNSASSVFASSLSTRVRGVIGVQMGGNTSSIQPNLLNSQRLSTSTGNQKYCEATGGTWSGSCTGGQTYTAFPNRAVDRVQTIAGAPYAGGANLCTGPDLACTPISRDAPWYQSLVTAWEGGDTATAIALIDTDIRDYRFGVQTVTASGTTFTTPTAHQFTTADNVYFTVTGGTTYANITPGRLYQVTGTSTAGCPGGVVCNFTVEAYVGNARSFSTLNAGAAGSGTTSVGAQTGTQRNMRVMESIWYKTWEDIAAGYDSQRSGGGLAAIRNEWYEGALEPKGPDASQCTSLGVTGSDCAGSIAAAITAWKNSSTGRATQKAYYDRFMGYDSSQALTYGLMTHSKGASNLTLLNTTPGCNADPWAVYSACLPSATPFQTYYGIYDFNSLPKVN